jgi:hypothetical protein
MKEHNRELELDIESVLCLRNIATIWDLTARDTLAAQVRR